MTKARACKGASQEWSMGVTFHVPGNVGECEGMNPQLPSELPLWELESWWILEYSDDDFRGQNYQFDSWPLKVGIALIYFRVGGMPYIVGKLLTRIQLCFKPHLNQRSKKNLGFQSRKSFNFENFGTPNLGVLGQNDIWVHAPWPSTNNTIRGKVVASPKIRPWWVLWVCVCPSVHQKCFNYVLTNLLFGLCRSVWIIDPLVIPRSPHLGVLPCPSTSEVLQAKKCTLIPYPSIVFTLDSLLSLSRSLGCIKNGMWCCWCRRCFCC